MKKMRIMALILISALLAVMTCCCTGMKNEKPVAVITPSEPATGAQSSPVSASATPVASPSSTDAANPTPGESTAAVTPADPEKTFTLQELAAYDGREGRKAYVAADGIVYDVSGSEDWPGGIHKQCKKGAVAGKDLTEVLKVAPPSMKKYIKEMPVVGKLKGK